MTKIIQKVVNGNDRNSILIIDDLDRLDPEHVFRILNVFSAHLGGDQQDDRANKLGFQKIILVCDFNNIRTIFHHRYGPGADFIGYIDKFFSTEVFHMDNKSAIISIVKKVLEKISLLSVDFNEQAYAKELLLGDKVLHELIALMIQRGFMSLRSILRMWEKESNLIYKELSFSKKVGEVKGYQIPIIMQLKLLVDFTGDHVQLEQAFQQFEKAGTALIGYESIFGYLITLCTLLGRHA